MEHEGRAPPAGAKGLLGRDRSHAAINHMADGAGVRGVDRTLIRALHNAFRLYSVWSAEHSIRVGLLVDGFFGVLGASREKAARHGLCSCLHDIGKLAVPQAIIEKPGKLTEAEREIVQVHVIAGENALDALQTADREIAAEAIRHHHENLDGSGYPDGLAGREISRFCRIARICDFYDALAFDRPYRAGLGRAESLAVMDGVARFFDPELFRSFKANLAAIDRIDGGRAAAAPGGGPA